ncbi:MAG: pentapeptide repeat-containing protein [Pseudomonadota bacterium]
MAYLQPFIQIMHLILLSLLLPSFSFAAQFFNLNVFEGANIELSDHHGADMKNVNFQGTNMMRANFKGSNVSNANFKEANMQEADFEKAILSSANLLNANITRTNFLSAHLDNANLQNTQASFANFQNTNLQKSNFQASDLRLASFQYADLTQANLQSADIFQTSFKGAKLIVTNFKGSAMELNSFEDADIQGANFQGVNLSDSNFRYAYIHPATPNDTTYSPFGCIASTLRAKTLRDLNIKEDAQWKKVGDNMINLQPIETPTEICTNFQEVSFKDAILHNVNFSNPEHFKYANITVAHLCKAQSLFGSTFPKHIMNAIKRDKSCSKKLTNKALFERVKDNFLKQSLKESLH